MPPSITLANNNDFDEEGELMFTKAPSKHFGKEDNDFDEVLDLIDDNNSVAAGQAPQNAVVNRNQGYMSSKIDEIRGRPQHFNNNNNQGKPMDNQFSRQINNNNISGGMIHNQSQKQKPMGQQNPQANRGGVIPVSGSNKRKPNGESDDETEDSWGQPLNGNWQPNGKKKQKTGQKFPGEDSDDSEWSDDDMKINTINNRNSFNNSKVTSSNNNKKIGGIMSQPKDKPIANVHKPIDISGDTRFNGMQLPKSVQNEILRDEKKEEENALALKSLKQVYQLISAKNLSSETKLKDITKIFSENESLKKMVIPKPKPKTKDKNNNSSSSGSKVNKKKAARLEAEEEGSVYKKDTSKMNPEQRKAYLKEQKAEKERLDRERRDKLNRELEEEDKKEEEEAKEEIKKAGRQDIRKIMNDEKLSESTKVADATERERRAKMDEKHRIYLETFEIEKDKKVQMLPLDFDTETKEVILEVHEHLWKGMKPHQARGIKFVFDAVFESKKAIEEVKCPGGAIMAHCMGLGKTLSSIGVIHTVMVNFPSKIKHTLVLTPVNTIKNWCDEFAKWVTGPLVDDIEVFDMTEKKDPIGRAEHLQLWKKEGGVMVMGYEMFRNLCDENSKANADKTQSKIYAKTLLNPGPELVVCDEGHVLKNKNSALSAAMSRIKTKRRIVLTGTPLQNNLGEYYAMCDFVKPNLLGTFLEFKNRFVNPIQNGQHSDSTDRDVRIMKKRSFILSDLLKGCMQRLDYNILVPYLNPKHEYVLCISLTKFQTDLYQYYLDHFAQNKLGKDGSLQTTKKAGGLFFDVQNLKLIWNHPYLLTMRKPSRLDKIMVELDSDEERKRKGEGKDDESEEDPEFGENLNDWSMKKPKENETKPGDTEGDTNKEKIEGSEEKAEGDLVSKEATKDDSGIADDKKSSEGEQKEKAEGETKPESKKEVKDKNPWWHKFVDKSEGAEDAKTQLNKVELGSKMVLLFDILSEAEQVGDKVLVFSQSIPSLDLIEVFLAQMDQSRTKKHNIDADDEDYYVGCWQKNRDYYRMDGSTSVDSRKKWCAAFNEEDSHRARLFIISTKAGGIGINLVAANRVIIFDASWNPSHDVQSIFRVYRFGQTKPVYVYRFVAQGTMEEKIYDRQVAKQSLSARVVDEQQIERHFSSNDLSELYKFQEEKLEDRPTPKVPKDVLLAELLKRHGDMVYKFHDHDSLLENQVDENLTEEERKAAWQEFENEKKGIQQLEQGKMLGQMGQMPGMMPGGGMMGSLNAGMMGNLNPAVIQAQYRKQYPTWSNEEIIKQTRRYISQRQFEMAKKNAMNRPGGQQGGLNPMVNASMANRLLPGQQQPFGSKFPGTPNYNPSYGQANMYPQNGLYPRPNAMNLQQRLNPLQGVLPAAAGGNNIMYSNTEDIKQQADIAKQIAALQNQQQQLQTKAMRKQGANPRAALLARQNPQLADAGRRPNPYNLNSGPTEAQKMLQARMGKYPTLMEQQRARMQMQRKLMRRKAMQEKTGGKEGDAAEDITLSSDEDTGTDPFDKNLSSIQLKKGLAEEGGDGQANIKDTIQKYYEKIGLQKKAGGDDKSETKKFGSLEISSVGKTPSLASTLANLPGLNDSWKTKFLSNYKNSVDSGKSSTKTSKEDLVELDESEDSPNEAADNTPGDSLQASEELADDNEMSAAGSTPLEDTETQNSVTRDISEQGNIESGDIAGDGNNNAPEDTDIGDTEGADLPLED